MTPREEAIAALVKLMNGPGFWQSPLAKSVSACHAALLRELHHG